MNEEEKINLSGSFKSPGLPDVEKIKKNVEGFKKFLNKPLKYDQNHKTGGESYSDVAQRMKTGQEPPAQQQTSTYTGLGGGIGKFLDQAVKTGKEAADNVMTGKHINVMPEDGKKKIKEEETPLIDAFLRLHEKQLMGSQSDFKNFQKYNQGATYGQYLNTIRGLTAKTGSANDPSVIAKQNEPKGLKTWNPNAPIKTQTVEPAPPAAYDKTIPGASYKPLPSERFQPTSPSASPSATTDTSSEKRAQDMMRDRTSPKGKLIPPSEAGIPAKTNNEETDYVNPAEKLRMPKDMTGGQYQGPTPGRPLRLPKDMANAQPPVEVRPTDPERLKKPVATIPFQMKEYLDRTSGKPPMKEDVSDTVKDLYNRAKEAITGSSKGNRLTPSEPERSTEIFKAEPGSKQSFGMSDYPGKNIGQGNKFSSRVPKDDDKPMSGISPAPKPMSGISPAPKPYFDYQNRQYRGIPPHQTGKGRAIDSNRETYLEQTKPQSETPWSGGYHQSLQGTSGSGTAETGQSGSTGPDYSETTPKQKSTPTTPKYEDGGKKGKKMSEENNKLIDMFLKLQEKNTLTPNIFEAAKKMSSKEKSLASLGHPKDKITKKDVLIGRGVLPRDVEEGAGEETAKKETSMSVTMDNKPSTPAQTTAATSGPSASDKKALDTKIKSIAKEEVEEIDEAKKEKPHWEKYPIYTATGRYKPPQSVIDKYYPEHSKKKTSQSGIKAAKEKLAKEEVELDELLKDTLKSYVDKAKKDVYFLHGDPKRSETKIKKQRRAGIKAAKEKLAKEEVEFSQAEIDHINSFFEAVAPSRAEPTKGVNPTVRNTDLTDETLEELDKKTLKSYVGKVEKRGETEKRSEGLYRAQKGIAKQTSTKTLDAKVRKLASTPMNQAKHDFEYDASREELKNRNIHHFAGRRTRYEEVELEEGRPRKNPTPETTERDARQHIQVQAGRASGGTVVDFKHDNGKISKLTPGMGRAITAHLNGLKPAERQEAVKRMHASPEGLKV